jgi:hypothetical protein
MDDDEWTAIQFLLFFDETEAERVARVQEQQRRAAARTTDASAAQTTESPLPPLAPPPAAARSGWQRMWHWFRGNE